MFLHLLGFAYSRPATSHFPSCKPSFLAAKPLSSLGITCYASVRKHLFAQKSAFSPLKNAMRQASR
jgi:hypothetical protein